MSRTLAHNPKTKPIKGRPKGRGNPLGVCHCMQCKYVRRHAVRIADKVQNKIRNWKSNREPTKGVYYA